MNRADRQRWGAARTLAGLGELTALWLEGGIASQPGYAPNCGPAEETHALVQVLAAANRAGFVTDASQPGDCWQNWDQRAAVEGFAAPGAAGRLREAAGASGLLVRVQAASRWRNGYGQAVAVTRCSGRDVTRFGVQLSRRQIRDGHLGYGVCHPDAVRALRAAFRVTLIDPEWGRNDLLWPVLARFAGLPQEAKP